VAGKRTGFIDLLVESDFSRADWFDAIRGSLVVAILFIGLATTGNVGIILPMSMGAVFVAVAEAGLPFGRRWRTMLWTTLWLMVAVLVAASLSDSWLLIVAITAPVAFVCGAVGYLGPRAAITGMLALVVFAGFAGFPVALDNAPREAALIGLGGLIQTVVCVLIGIVRHRGDLHALDTVHHPSVSSLRTDQQAFLRHGIRLAIVMTIATTISELASFPHAYWLPVAVAWMTRPDRKGTVDRVIQRLMGTGLGVILIGVPGWLLGTSPNFYIVFALIGATVAIAFIWVNYNIGVAGVTIWLLAVIGLAGGPFGEDITIRLGLTVGAAILVLAGTLLVRGKALD